MDIWQITEIAGAVAGLIYLWLELRASVWLWVAGIVMPAIYTFVYLHKGVYANVGINAYFIIAGIYGLVAWKRGAGDGSEKPITHAPRRVWPPALAMGAALFVAITFVLREYTDSPAPWPDAFTTAFSVVGLWMLARKFVEQWLIWIVVDAVYTAMYIHLDLYPTAAMYAIFSAGAVYGYFKWTKMMRAQ